MDISIFSELVRPVIFGLLGYYNGYQGGGNGFILNYSNVYWLKIIMGQNAVIL